MSGVAAFVNERDLAYACGVGREYDRITREIASLTLEVELMDEAIVIQPGAPIDARAMEAVE